MSRRGSSRRSARCAAGSSAPRRRRRRRFVGTLRQPATSSSSRCELRARAPRAAGASAGSRFRKHEPGGETARRARCRASARHRAQELLGRFSSRPQPSPVLPSAATAPRWVRRLREVIAGPDQPMARLVVEVGDQAEPAAIALDTIPGIIPDRRYPYGGLGRAGRSPGDAGRDLKFLCVMRPLAGAMVRRYLQSR